MQTIDQGELNEHSYQREQTKSSTSNLVKKPLNVFANLFRLKPVITTMNLTPLRFDFLKIVYNTICKEMATTPNAKSNILNISKFFDRIVEDAIAIVHGNDTIPRPVDTNLEQKIVGLINTHINEINFELLVFQLLLSRQIIAFIHISIMILLTNLYYNEQRNHFDQQMSTLNEEKESVLTYFISMVVPDEQCDEKGAHIFANKVKKAVQSNLIRDAQQIIAHIIQTQQKLNRKQIQIICDEKLQAVAYDNDWLFRYIDAPTDIIVEEFQMLWKQVEKTINQQLENEKYQWKNILIEFFNCIEFMISSLANEGSPKRFVDDIFQSSDGCAAENLRNKGQCMVLLLYDYLSGNKIEAGTFYTVLNLNYTLNSKVLRLFKKLPRPSQQLTTLIKGMRNVDDSNDNRMAITSIKIWHVFLQSIMDVKEIIVGTYDRSSATFAAYDKDEIYIKLLDEIRGCTSKCPHCQRPCDTDHSLGKYSA
ncbi:unnamed protein product, partial [Didymodactylos carnosus]